MKHIRHRLARRRLRKEYHEVDGMAFMRGDSDFGFTLEAPDPWSMARAGIENDDRRLHRIETILKAFVPIARDPQQRVVDGSLEAARIEDQLVVEIEQRRLPCPLMRDH